MIREQIEVHYSRPYPNELVPPIENCEPWFRYECPRKWHSLTPTEDKSVRHCPECNELVYKYGSRAELAGLRGKRCVYIAGSELGEMEF